VQEVVIETNSHFHDLEQLPESHIARLLLVYAHRTVEITKNDKIEYVLIFKNQGGKAGASLEHSHSQIFATDFIPPQLIDKSIRAQKYKLEHGSCVYCDTIKKEQEGERLIYKDEYVIAFCPFASMYNYEVWIMPMRHLDNITLLNDDERLAWAVILKKVLSKIVLLGFDYNFYFHQVVNDEDQHFYMKVTPRGSTWAGVEIGSGVVINPVAPEDAAKYFSSE
jgi:UDPglucose--hexose-1-phosphate uridylyltransferase